MNTSSDFVGKNGMKVCVISHQDGENKENLNMGRRIGNIEANNLTWLTKTCFFFNAAALPACLAMLLSMVITSGITMRFENSESAWFMFSKPVSMTGGGVPQNTNHP